MWNLVNKLQFFNKLYNKPIYKNIKNKVVKNNKQNNKQNNNKCLCNTCENIGHSICGYTKNCYVKENCVYHIKK